MVVDLEGLDLNLLPEGQSDQDTYMKVQSQGVPLYELEEVAALAEAPLRSGEEGRQREVGQGVRAAGEVECGATPDTAEPELPFRWAPIAPSTDCSSAPHQGAPGMRPDAELEYLTAISTR